MLVVEPPPPAAMVPGEAALLANRCQTAVTWNTSSLVCALYVFWGLGVSVPLGVRTQWVLPSRVTETAVWSGLVVYSVIYVDI